jgi:hypothetical protein
MLNSKAFENAQDRAAQVHGIALIPGNLDVAQAMISEKMAEV